MSSLYILQVLDSGMEVLIYNGMHDAIVNIAGMNRVVNSLAWSRKKVFAAAKPHSMWVWNEDSGLTELAAYFTEGGGLTYMVVRNAGHMVPISQPRVAERIVYEFTHRVAESAGGKRFTKPRQRKTSKAKPFVKCGV